MNVNASKHALHTRYSFLGEPNQHILEISILGERIELPVDENVVIRLESMIENFESEAGASDQVEYGQSIDPDSIDFTYVATDYDIGELSEDEEGD